MPTEQPLEHLMNKYGDTIFRLCYLYLKDYQLAEDATQETFIKAMNAYNTFQHKSSEKTWITRIAINCSKNIMRTHWFRNLQNNYADSMQPETENPIESFLEKNSISKAIMELPVNDRKIILLYYYQDLTIKEIAAIIGKSENTTIQRLNRARGKLKKILMEVGYEER
ncbi:MAG: sigma-70 family RNA polymerase sigma factor [Lachnospiraceae bacterium]|nr:sigma-70 family RNA polymerase sigma factor [Lachnospiraceae bacterium]